MKHRIRVAGLVLDSEQRILLVREVDQLTGGEYWVPPGGGLEPQDSSVLECLRREILEETGVSAVKIGRLVYLREFSETSRQAHHIELFFEVREVEGTIRSDHSPFVVPDAELTRPARWFEQSELSDLRVYPAELKCDFWLRCSSGVESTMYLGVNSD